MKTCIHSAKLFWMSNMEVIHIILYPSASFFVQRLLYIYIHCAMNEDDLWLKFMFPHPLKLAHHLTFKCAPRLRQKKKTFFQNHFQASSWDNMNFFQKNDSTTIYFFFHPKLPRNNKISIVREQIFLQGTDPHNDHLLETYKWRHKHNKQLLLKS